MTNQTFAAGSQEAVGSVVHELELANVEKVYSGRDGCRCGCGGNYSYSTTAKREEWQGKVNPAMIRKVVRYMIENAAEVEVMESGDDELIFNVELPSGRVYTAYVTRVAGDDTSYVDMAAR